MLKIERNILIVLLLVAGCDDGSGNNENQNEQENENDAGSDASTDTDTATGTALQQCAMNSGWPCNCELRQECDDGSLCTGIVGMDNASGTFCSAKCDDKGNCPDTPWDASSICGLINSGCVLHCKEDNQCPPEQTCQSNGQTKFCYPDGA
jgi:hypothetical protein